MELTSQILHNSKEPMFLLSPIPLLRSSFHCHCASITNDCEGKTLVRKQTADWRLFKQLAGDPTKHPFTKSAMSVSASHQKIGFFLLH